MKLESLSIWSFYGVSHMTFDFGLPNFGVKFQVH